MSTAAPSANGSETSTGRDSKGRFTRGNPGGIGNPFARKVAQLRSALIERVTEQDIKDIAEVLILQARTGDHAAIKLLFQYVLGKPAPAADPDTVEIDEFQKIYAPQREIMEQFPETIHSIPPGMVCAVTRIINEICVGQLRSMLEGETAAERAGPANPKSDNRNSNHARNPHAEIPQDAAAEADSRPSTHGGNGDDGVAGDKASVTSGHGGNRLEENRFHDGADGADGAADIAGFVESLLAAAPRRTAAPTRPSPNGRGKPSRAA